MAHKYLYVHNRKRILKEIGLYNGETTTENKTASYKKAVLLLNKKYLSKQYHTELYYIATDNILRTIDNIKIAKSEHFKVEEFRCNCGGKYCAGFPATVSKNLLIDLETIRNTVDQPVRITSGLRCKRYNNSLRNSSKVSAHMTGKAADWCSSVTSKRIKRIDLCKSLAMLPHHFFCYTDETRNNGPMGTSIHYEVK